MNKVIIINLNGNAYQLEEDAFDALRAYLDVARARLEGNPDRDEIIADIEQAIADKFRAVLGSAKTVVLASEVKAVIDEMGPVEAAGEPGAAPGAAPAGGAREAPGATQAGGQAAPRRLFRIHDGAMVAGVCNGLAAYLGLDVSLVRIIFIVLTLIWGFGAVVYLVMAFIVPAATTPDERAAAFGTPSTTQDFIKRARAGYYDGMRAFKDKHEYREWRRKFRQEMRGWRQQFKMEMQRNAHQWACNWRQHWSQNAPPVFFGGMILAPLFALASMLVTLGVLYAIYSILVHGSAFGVSVPAGVPHWAAIVILVIVVQFVVWPLRIMRHLATGAYAAPYYHPFVHLWNGFAGLAVFVILLWLFVHHPAQAQDALHSFLHEMRAAFESFRSWLNTL